MRCDDITHLFELLCVSNELISTYQLLENSASGIVLSKSSHCFWRKSHSTVFIIVFFRIEFFPKESQGIY